MVKIGIFGGSGLDDPDLLEKASEMHVRTPYGAPSSELTVGSIGQKEVVLMARHGKKHQYSPSQVNYRGNVWAFRELGVTHIIATTACGSLREKIGRGDLIILDQFIDFTRQRKNTFHESFANGAVHTAMAEPFDGGLRKVLIEAATALGYKIHPRGTMITIEGPRFSTRAESNMFRAWGADAVNMSVATEAALANEAGIPYAAVAMSTDYDCWKEDEAPVTWDEIMTVFKQNADRVINLLKHVVPKIE